MVHFLIHEKSDTVGVATVDIRSGEEAEGLYMDNQETIKVNALKDIRLGHKIALTNAGEGDTVIKYGNIVGNPIVPVIKLSANPLTCETMSEHIDLNVSAILKGELTLDEAGDQLIDMVRRTCNGRFTATEALGHREFVLTKLYISA